MRELTRDKDRLEHILEAIGNDQSWGQVFDLRNDDFNIKKGVEFVLLKQLSYLCA